MSNILTTRKLLPFTPSLENKFKTVYCPVGERMNEKMISYDPKTDILYLVVREGIEDHFEEIVDGVVVELDSTGQLLGIEIMNASHLRHIIEPTIAQEMHTTRITA